MELLLEWLGLNEQSLNYLLNPNAIKRMGLNDIELSTGLTQRHQKLQLRLRFANFSTKFVTRP